MNRTRSYRRAIRNREITRKKKICKQLYWIGSNWYEHDGQYSKGKIHCSCPMCTYNKTFDLPRLKDLKEKDFVKQALFDWYETSS